MAFSAIGTYACRALQQKLIDYYGANTAEAKTMGSNALVRWLLSPQNTAGFLQIADGITQTVPGKKRAVAFALDQPFCFDVCAIANVNCNTVRGDITNPTQEIVFDMDGPAFRVGDSEGNPLRLVFDHADLAKYCTETDTSYITRQIARIGGKVLNKLMMYAKWAGLSDAGIDLSAIDDISPYAFYDRFLDATIGINQFFQLSPGAVQLVTFNENIGENNRRVTDLYTHSTFVDQATGLEVDFEWFYDPKCRTWTYEPNLSAQLAVAPPGGCGIPNANGVLLIEDCSGGATAPVCPESG